VTSIEERVNFAGADQAPRRLAHRPGTLLGSGQLDFIINHDIKYHMGQESGESNGNDGEGEE
jgi:hypothetical protein